MISQLSRNEHFFRVVFLVVQISMKFCLWLIRNINHVPFDTQPHTFEVGTHPNILRLLESYQASRDGVVVVVVVALGHAFFGQGFNGEDVLVLEYCDGSTLYDLYAREHPKARVFQGEVIPFLSSWWSPKCWDSPKSSDVRFNLDLQKLK